MASLDCPHFLWTASARAEEPEHVKKLRILDLAGDSFPFRGRQVGDPPTRLGLFHSLDRAVFDQPLFD